MLNGTHHGGQALRLPLLHYGVAVLRSWSILQTR